MADTFTTLPGILRHVNRTFQNPTALAYKKDGVWLSISTQELFLTVRRLGSGLIKMGLKPGDRVGIVADSSPFWMMFDLAVLGAGGITVPMFSNISPDNLKYEIQDSGMRYLFVGSEAQHKAMKPFFGSLERVLALNESDGCISWNGLLKDGDQRLVENSGEWDALSESVAEGNTATLIYTSGSTGIPKGVELTHRNLVTQVRGAQHRFPMDPAKDSALTCLPMAHVFERLVTYVYLASGIKIHFAEDIKKVGENLREIHPTIITMVPRMLEKIYAKMQANVESASGFKKILGKAALQRAKEKPLGSLLSLKDRFLDAWVYGKMRLALGGRVRLLISGSAPLDPGLYAFFQNVGIPIYEGYGLTETSPVLAVNFPGQVKVGTVGPIFPGVEIRIADDGEILGRGPNIMKGYYGKPAETAQTIDASGWLHTGDLGHLDQQGFLKITGRKKELFKTANGKYVAPVPIEQALIGNRLIDMALVIAEGKPFTTALLFPDFENLKALKTELGCEIMDDVAFLHSPVALNFIQKDLDLLNGKLNHWEQVQKFHLASRALTIDAGELTPTLKIRQHVAEEKFRKEIDSMYAGG